MSPSPKHLQRLFILLLLILPLFGGGCQSVGDSYKEESEETARTVTDIDGNKYPTKAYGNTIWMLENLRVSRTPEGKQVRFHIPYNPDSLEGIERLLGYLYEYEAACQVCPIGWRLPTTKELDALFRPGEKEVAPLFKEPAFWKEAGNTNETGFSVRPAGVGNTGEFENYFGEKTYFLAADQTDDHFVWTYIFEKGKNTIRKAEQHPTYAFSIRCVMEK